MKRNLNKLANIKYDLLIIGGGIYGAVLFWEATVCGLSVVLIEKGDFAQANSANSQKIIHGGLRYLQQLNIPRVWQSIWSRRQLMSLAPHLVHPLKCLMPIYNNGMKEKEMMRLGLLVNDLIGFSRNGLLDKSKFIPNGKILSVSETNRFIPNLEQHNLKGAAQWHDTLCINTERLVLGFVRTACEMGAIAANYVKATKLIKSGNKIAGIKVQDQLTNDTFDIRAKRIANCAGPWVNELLPNFKSSEYAQEFASGINIIVKKLFPFPTAIGIKSKRGKDRLYFVVPWRGKSIVGTEYFPYHGHPDNYRASEKECQQLIQGFNQAYPAAQLKLDDVTFVHNGLLPNESPSFVGRDVVNISKKFKILDHGSDGINGYVSIIGVKYTTAEYVSAKVLRYLFPTVSIDRINHKQRLVGGDIDDFPLFKKQIIDKWKNGLDERRLENLVNNYGTEVEKVLQTAGLKNNSISRQNDLYSLIIRGQTLYAIREEMAMRLSDVILRRTDVGTLKRPHEDVLINISRYMAEELGWTEYRRQTEIQDVYNFYPHFLSYR